MGAALRPRRRALLDGLYLIVLVRPLKALVLFDLESRGGKWHLAEIDRRPTPEEGETLCGVGVNKLGSGSRTAIAIVHSGRWMLYLKAMRPRIVIPPIDPDAGDDPCRSCLTSYFPWKRSSEVNSWDQ